MKITVNKVFRIIRNNVNSELNLETIIHDNVLVQWHDWSIIRCKEINHYIRFVFYLISIYCELMFNFFVKEMFLYKNGSSEVLEVQ